jgi:hypothetical protein
MPTNVLTIFFGFSGSYLVFVYYQINFADWATYQLHYSERLTITDIDS